MDVMMESFCHKTTDYHAESTYSVTVFMLKGTVTELQIEALDS